MDRRGVIRLVLVVNWLLFAVAGNGLYGHALLWHSVSQKQARAEMIAAGVADPDADAARPELWRRAADIRARFDAGYQVGWYGWAILLGGSTPRDGSRADDRVPEAAGGPERLTRAVPRRARPGLVSVDSQSSSSRWKSTRLHVVLPLPV